MEVDHDDDVAIGGEEFRIPAIRPVVSPGTLRAPMDEELHGIFLVGIEVGRFDEETLNLVAEGAREPEGFDGGQGDLGERYIVEMRKSSGFGRRASGSSHSPLSRNFGAHLLTVSGI